MFSQTIGKDTRSVLEKIGKSWLVKDFHLAGGTALAIQLGHRESIDLDWFSSAPFSNSKIKNTLAEIGKFKLENEEEGTIHGILDGVRVSFFHYDYKLLFPFIKFVDIKIADERDISAMKLDAISSRGSKKDFVDYYFLLKKYTLEELVGFFEQKFSQIEFNRLHLLKSLVYFEDAEDEPMPIMLQSASWEEIKSQVELKVNEYLKKIIA
ncbi:MAG: nucleotidyl transferase AbiEii/AbiGii toxin family protein [Candidatus Moraniibacteriota bacterium]